MPFQTLLVQDHQTSTSVTLNRLEQQNAINSTLLTELNLILDDAEQKPECRCIILRGQQGLFCSGMDLQEYTQLADSEKAMHNWATLYMKTLKRLASSSKVIIAAVDGKVVAGGVGLVSASDFALGTEKASFKLTEALWGLIPAMVAPYLIRRVGFQAAYSLALTTRTIAAQEALGIRLLDTCCDNLEEAIGSLTQRIERVGSKTVKALKTYFGQLAITEEVETMAVEETVRRMVDPDVRSKINDFLVHGKRP